MDEVDGGVHDGVIVKVEISVDLRGWRQDGPERRGVAGVGEVVDIFSVKWTTIASRSKVKS